MIIFIILSIALLIETESTIYSKYFNKKIDNIKERLKLVEENIELSMNDVI